MSPPVRAAEPAIHVRPPPSQSLSLGPQHLSSVNTAGPSVPTPSFPGPPRSPVSTQSSPLPAFLPVPTDPLPVGPPTRVLLPSISSPDLIYENRLLREQLNASQEDLRLARDQMARERSRHDRMSAIYQEQIARLEAKGGSTSGGPPFTK